VVVVANGVGVGAAAAERVAVVVVAVQAAAVGGQVGVLHARAADLLEAAVGVGPVHVPDQVWMLVVVVRGRIAGELLVPGNGGRPHRAAGAQRVAGHGGVDAAFVDVVLQRRRRRDGHGAAARGSAAALAAQVLREGAEHEDVVLVGAAIGRRIAVPGDVVGLRLQVTAAAQLHRHVELQFGDRHAGGIRGAQALGQAFADADGGG